MTNAEEPLIGPKTGARVLLVDNDPEVSEMLELFLSRSGFLVTSVTSGQDGLRRLTDAAREGHRFDVVVLDLRMPGMGGLEFLTRLERATDGMQTPVIVVSGFIRDEDRELLDASPLVHAVLNKPFDLLDLLSATRAASHRVEPGFREN